jgi:iron complex transport system substrate-binding protein
MRRAFFIALAVALLPCAPAWAQLSLVDDMGRTVAVKGEPKRIVTLAPFLTEIVFAAGAGNRVVGVDALSEYPPEAMALPKIQSGEKFTLDQVAVLKPDLVLAWRDGIRREYVDAMTAFGTTVYVASARQLEDVPRLLTVVGRLTGKDVTAPVDAFEEKVQRLRRENANKRPMSVFLEIWNRPLRTVSGFHYLNDALAICRAENVFRDLPGSLPEITWEELYERNPFVIVGAGSASNRDEFLANWRLRRALAAVREDRMVFLDVDTIQRPTPRTPDGIEQLCAGLDAVRLGLAPGAVPPTAAVREMPAPGRSSVLLRDPREPPPETPAKVPALATPKPAVPVPAAPAAQVATPAPAAPAPQAEPAAPVRRWSQFGD